MKSILVIADTHWISGEPFHLSYRLVKKFAKAFRPDVVVHLGDLLDLSYISKFNQENLKVLSGSHFAKDYELANKELDFWQSVTKKFVLIEGNHDERIGRLLEKKPILEGLIEYAIALGFEKRKIQFYPLIGDPCRIGKLTFIHGSYTVKYVARKHLDEYCHNVVFGHVHRFQTAGKVLPIHKEEIQAWSLGCLNDVQPDWQKGRPTSWQNGFGVVYMNKDGTFNMFPINIIGGQFIFEGKRWKLSE